MLLGVRALGNPLNKTLKHVDTTIATAAIATATTTCRSTRYHHFISTQQQQQQQQTSDSTLSFATTWCSCPQAGLRNMSARFQWSHVVIRRNLSMSSRTYGVAAPSISSRLAADRLIRDMSEDERSHLEQALNGLKEELHLESDTLDAPPTTRQLLLTGVTNALPFIGFGFLDNAVMIVAGEYIDITLGQAFGISTMAAAALGNMVSDMAGIGLAGYVEVLASGLGIEEPHLTGQQLMMKSTRFANYGGRALGIMFGCFLGMFPLLFFDGRDDEEAEKAKE